MHAEKKIKMQQNRSTNAVLKSSVQTEIYRKVSFDVGKCHRKPV